MHTVNFVITKCITHQLSCTTRSTCSCHLSQFVAVVSFSNYAASSQRWLDESKSFEQESKFVMGASVQVFKTERKESSTKLALSPENGAYRFNAWETELKSYSGPGRHHPITFSIGDFGYLMAGNYASSSAGLTFDIHRFQPGSGWSQLSLPTPAPKGPREFSYGVGLGGSGYLGFGIVDGRPTGDWWRYNPASNTFTELQTFPGLERYHPAMVAVEVNRGRPEGVEQLIYVGCGGSDDGNLKDWWEYSVASDSWVRCADLPGPPRHHPYFWSAMTDNRMFAFVGFGHGNYGDPKKNEPFLQIYNDVYRFDPSSLTWRQMKDFPGEARVAGTQFSFHGRGYILSGDGSDHSHMPTGEMYEYDASKDTWGKFPPHPGRSRWAPGSFVIGSSVYFTSGYNRVTERHRKDLIRYSLCDCDKSVTTAKSAGCNECGSLKSGKPSCCGVGGSWFGRCGHTVVSGKTDRTWSEGVRVCESKLACHSLKQ